MVYGISDIGRCQKYGKYDPCTWRTAEVKDFELILTRGRSRSRDWRGPYGERGARAYNGGLGAVPPTGSRGRAPGQGAKPPLKLNAFWYVMSEMALNCYVYELFYGH